MAEPQERPPIKADLQMSPLAELSGGNLYPVWDLKEQEGGLRPFFNAFSRTFAFLNPFIQQQVPTNQRMGVEVRYGDGFYRPPLYPNSYVIEHKFPTHYEPLNDVRWKQPQDAETLSQKSVVQVETKLVPRFCQREIHTYKRCLVANDDDQVICNDEKEGIMAICPSWALNNLKERKLQLMKEEGLLNKQYREVMKISEYNRGRTIFDIPKASWEAGNRHNLRPNTLYADDRYHDVTQQEINAAKQRCRKRQLAKPAPAETIPVYDRTFEDPPRRIPLYSVQTM